MDTRIGGDWVVTDDRKYIWDGWLQLAELDALDSESGGRARLLKTYVWGLDIAGQSGGGGSAGGGSAGRDAAAGIGGLLAVYDTSGTTTGGDPTADDKMFFYCYDANGNVGQLVDWRDSAVTPAGANWAASRVVAAYEYDPYGGIVSETGSYAASNRWCFSTREFDAVTGLGHWPARVYEAKTGRWGSRDPLEERPHPLVYSFLNNAPVRHIDPLGQYTKHIDIAWTDPTPGSAKSGLFDEKCILDNLQTIVNACCALPPQCKCGVLVTIRQTTQVIPAGAKAPPGLSPSLFTEEVYDPARGKSRTRCGGFSVLVKLDRTAPHPNKSLASIDGPIVILNTDNLLGQLNSPQADLCVTYANVLAHEIGWHGIADERDINAPGDFRSTSGVPVDKLFDATTPGFGAACDAIKRKLRN